MRYNEQTLTKLCQEKRQGDFLNLAECLLEDVNLVTLLNFIKAHNISHLDISSNRITGTGAELLAGCDSLWILNINFNCIGSKGAIALSKSPNLRSLHAASNSIGFEGIEALSKNTVLHTLDIRFNKLSLEALALFYTNETLSQLEVYDEALTKQHLGWVQALMARNLENQSQLLLLEHIKTADVCSIIQSYAHKPHLLPNPILFFTHAPSPSLTQPRIRSMNHNLT